MPYAQIGLQLATLRLPLKAGLREAARIGYRAVELNVRTEINPRELTGTALRQLRKLLEDQQLRVAALAYPTRRGYDVAADLDRRVAGTKAAMKLARDLGADVVVNAIGRIPADDQSEVWRLLIEVLTDLGRHGDKVGARLAADTGGEEGADVARLLAALPESSLAVNLNAGQLIANGHSPLAAIEALGASIAHVHVQDGMRDSARGRGIEVELGRGSVDFPAIFAALDERSYRGWFTVSQRFADEPVAAAQRALEYVTRVLHGE